MDRGIITNRFDSNGMLLDSNEWKQKREKLGLCISCPNQLYIIKRSSIFLVQKIPITNGNVFDGRCLDCDPMSTRILSSTIDLNDASSDSKAQSNGTEPNRFSNGGTPDKLLRMLNGKNRKKKKTPTVRPARRKQERRRMQGLCESCPNKLYRFEYNRENPLRRIKVPITNLRVSNGHCLDCHPGTKARDFNLIDNNSNEDDGEGATSDSEVQNILRNSRSKVCRNSMAGLFSSGTFDDNMLNEVADEINDYNNEVTESSQFKKRRSRKGSNVSLPLTDSDMAEFEMNTLQCLRFRKSPEWKTSQLKPLSDEHYEYVGNVTLLLLTKSLDGGKKLSLIEDLLHLVHDNLIKTEILFSGGIPAFHKIMTEDIDDESLQLKTLTLLKKIIPFSEDEFLEEAPLVEDILMSMVKHEKCLEIQENAIICLIAILTKSNKYKSRINNENGINVVLSTLERHKSSRVVEGGNLLITSLID